MNVMRFIRMEVDYDNRPKIVCGGLSREVKKVPCWATVGWWQGFMGWAGDNPGLFEAALGKFEAEGVKEVIFNYVSDSVLSGARPQLIESEAPIAVKLDTIQVRVLPEDSYVYVLADIVAQVRRKGGQSEGVDKAEDGTEILLRLTRYLLEENVARMN